MSYRELVEMMEECGIALAHTIILSWVQRLSDFCLIGCIQFVPNKSRGTAIWELRSFLFLTYRDLS